MTTEEINQLAIDWDCTFAAYDISDEDFERFLCTLDSLEE